MYTGLIKTLGRCASQITVVTIDLQALDEPRRVPGCGGCRLFQWEAEGGSCYEANTCPEMLHS